VQLNLNGKVALVTASSGGIGLAIASSLAAEGAKVAVNGRTSQSVEKALAAIRSSIPLVADNGTAAGCEKTIAELPAVAFVCSDRASAINGAALRIDGGLVRSVF
jgi:3-oxoacyl-[acyl-carrier protein] reductase